MNFTPVSLGSERVQRYVSNYIFFVKLFMLFMSVAPDCYYAIKLLLIGSLTNFNKFCNC